jgi:nucleotide-binding universal stress UspA family protein
MLNRILCATDGSKSSEKAVDFAIRLARQEEAELTFVTVNTVSDEAASHTYFWDSSVLEAGDAQIDRELQMAEGKAKAAGLTNFRSVTAHGKNIAATLIGFAEESGHDHIVTGSVGRTGVARLLMGSVAYEVVSKAHCPVTIVR